MKFDLILKNGIFFDGHGKPGFRCNIGVSGGIVTALSESPLAELDATRVLDVSGRWVMPGFIDLHTHYDAEIEIAPSLSESLRHGVTTVVLGSCSIDFSLGTAETLADMFCRVEAIPYAIVRPMLEKNKNWTSVADYVKHLETKPIGPNVAAFLGHSNLRAHVMGMERCLDRDVRPTDAELERMTMLLEEALSLGYLGMSIQTSPWDKMGGSKNYRSQPLPSTFATWREYRALTQVLRRHGAVFEGVPNLTTRVNLFLFLIESASFFVRKKLKTTIISMMDVRSDRMVYKLVGYFSRFFNRFLGADFKWQALPEPFDLWADGMDLVVFEEFGAGAAALHLQDPEARQRLLTDEDYRKWFRRQWKNKFLPKAFHRNLAFSEVLAAPDPLLVGKSFTQIAALRSKDPVDTFLDLVSDYGDKLRWYTVMGNDRLEPLKRIVSHPDILIGFSDAGAHLRNMAHYNYPLRLLKLVQDAIHEGRPFMTLEHAVYRLTGEIAEWLGLDVGCLRVGARADLVVINPEALSDQVNVASEAPMESMESFVRLVRRNPGVVQTVLVNGKVVMENEVVLPEVGRQKGFGRFLRAKYVAFKWRSQQGSNLQPPA